MNKHLLKKLEKRIKKAGFSNPENLKILKENITKGSSPLLAVSFKSNDKKIFAVESEQNFDVLKSILISETLKKIGETKDFTIIKTFNSNTTKESLIFFREFKEGISLETLINKKYEIELIKNVTGKAATLISALHKQKVNKKIEDFFGFNLKKYNSFGLERNVNDYAKWFSVELKKKKYKIPDKKKDLIKELFEKLEGPFDLPLNKNFKRTICHGDFHAAHIFLEKKRGNSDDLSKNKIYVIDYDWANLVNPMWDVGRFCGYLYKITDDEKLKVIQKIFIEKYIKSRNLKIKADDITNDKMFIFSQASSIKDSIIESVLYNKNKQRINHLTDKLNSKIRELYN